MTAKISSNPSICYIVSFPPLGNSDHDGVKLKRSFTAQLMTILVLIGMLFSII